MDVKESAIWIVPELSFQMGLLFTLKLWWKIQTEVSLNSQHRYFSSWAYHSFQDEKTLDQVGQHFFREKKTWILNGLYVGKRKKKQKTSKLLKRHKPLMAHTGWCFPITIGSKNTKILLHRQANTYWLGVYKQIKTIYKYVYTLKFW